MRRLIERTYFHACLALGRMLRSARYATTRVVDQDGERQVRKRRAAYAPLLVWMAGPLVRFLDTGVTVLSRKEWKERERRLYQGIYGRSIRIENDGTLVLPYLTGDTLATLLEDPQVEASVRMKAIGLAVIALADFHHLGFTHGDAMAENVMVDLETGVARWFDFETVHDSKRPLAWRRADDLRALLASCLLRTSPGNRPGALDAILDGYGDDEVSRLAASSFDSVLRRPLTFHLGQAGVSFRDFRAISRLLSVRSRPSGVHA